MRLRLIPSTVAIFVLAACAPSPEPPADAPSPGPAPVWATDDASAPETDGVHGMLLFGEKQLYLSHLPLYRGPHDWQIIVAARLLVDDRGPTAAYLADRAASGERVYTVEPERFHHAALNAAAAGVPVRFRATVYRGHFERGGTPILRNVVVEVTRVLEQRQLDAAEADAAEGSFLLFGTPGETYLAHRVAGSPDFDQVVAVEIPALRVNAPALARSVLVTVPGHAAGEPLREGAEVRLRTEADPR